MKNLAAVNILKVIHNKVAGDSPKLNLKTEKKVQNSVLELIKKGLINSAHDISEGGIISAIAECCIINNEKPIGAKVDLPIKSSEYFSFFSESQSRIIVSISQENKKSFEDLLTAKGQKFLLLGTTGGKKYSVNNKMEFELSELADIYFNTIPHIMND